MSNLLVKINYMATASALKGIRGYLEFLERSFDEAAIEAGKNLPEGISEDRRKEERRNADRRNKCLNF